MDESRGRRIGLNESIFREVNERLAELATGTIGVVEELDLVCECGETTCAKRIRVAHVDYESARSHASRFLVAPDHVLHDVERVLQKRPDYDLIEKNPGEPSEVAEETDPRA